MERLLQLTNVMREARRRLYRLKRKLLYPSSRDRLLFQLRFGRRNRLTIDTGKTSFQINTRSFTAKAHFYPLHARGGLYEAAVVRILEERCKPRSCFLDIGANVGFFTLLAAKLCYPGAVHAFELDPELVQEVYQNALLNQLENVYVVSGAVWETDGRFFCFSSYGNNKTMNILNNMSLTTSIWIPSLKIDSYCELQGINPSVIKIDVEGAEARVLSGMSDVLKGTETILVEVHPEMLPVFGDGLDKVIAPLQRAGFRLSIVRNHRGQDTPTFVPLSQAGPISQNCMLLGER